MRGLGRVLVVGGLITGSVMAISATPTHAVDLPLMRIGNATVVEGDTGVEVVRVPVDLTTPSLVPVTAQFSIQDGTATAFEDFAARTGKVTFRPGIAHMNISVITFGDTVLEPTETVDVHLSNPVNATLDTTDGSVTIIDDDSNPAAGIRASVGAIVVTRSRAGGHTAQIAVTMSQPVPTTAQLHFAMSCGFAAGLRLEASHGTITFLAGQQTKYLTFKVPNDAGIDGIVKLINTVSVLSGPVVIDQGRSESMILDPDDPEPVGTVIQQSVDSQGNAARFSQSQLCSGTGYSSWPAMSADGRYVAFVSSAKNLVPGDTNGMSDVFVHDNVTGTTERDSVASDGSQALYNISGSKDNIQPQIAISPDGRFVIFTSYRALTPGGGVPSDGGGGFYIHDRQTGDTTLMFPGADTVVAQMSADDRYILLMTERQLTPDDVDIQPNPNHDNLYGWFDDFRYDRVTGTYELVSKAYEDGVGAIGGPASMSADGRYIAFLGTQNVVPGGSSNCGAAFVKDMVTGAVQRVDIGPNGQLPLPTPDAPNCTTWVRGIELSANGQYVAFSSAAWNYVPGATTAPSPGTRPRMYAYVRDLVHQTTEFVGHQDSIALPPNAWPDGSAVVTGISGDGRFVSYEVANDVSTIATAYLYDRQTDEESIVGQLPDGTIPNNDTYTSKTGFDWNNAISADGRYIVFESSANNLTDNDSNNATDIFRQRIS